MIPTAYSEVTIPASLRAALTRHITAHTSHARSTSPAAWTDPNVLDARDDRDDFDDFDDFDELFIPTPVRFHCLAADGHRRPLSC